nr:MAG TPA: hypothetical protein [Caudoviricetes sp.]DAZ83523.1 MAG TPA: hypothetical protein [Caudoviricetes sp.]
MAAEIVLIAASMAEILNSIISLFMDLPYWLCENSQYTITEPDVDKRQAYIMKAHSIFHRSWGSVCN